MMLVPFGSGRLPADSHPGCIAMAGDGAFQFGSEVRGTLFEQVLVLPSKETPWTIRLSSFGSIGLSRSTTPSHYSGSISLPA